VTTYDIYTRVSNAQTIVDAADPVFYADNWVPIAVGVGPGGTAVVHDIGAGARVAFRCHVAESFKAGLTLRVAVVYADDASGTNLVEGGSEVLVDTDVALLGTEFNVPINPLTQALLAGNGKSHVSLRYTFSAANDTTGKISAWIPLGQSPTTPRRYAGNYTGP
jgi:hypothetical protein